MEHSTSLLKKEFLQRLENDYFGDLRLTDGPVSIHEFVDMVSVGNVAMRFLGGATKVVFPDLTNLGITFGEFLQRNIRFDDREVPVEVFFCEFFCEPIASALIHEIAYEEHESPDQKAAFEEVGVSTWDAWASEMAKPDRLLRLANVVADVAVETIAGRTLLSFFIRAPVVGKFSTWVPHANSGIGRNLPGRVIQGDGYSVATSMSRYEEIECSVTAYEWEAKLTMTGADEPDAAACGMIYVFERADGVPVGDLGDLIKVSDSVADTDILQTRAFIDQHDDAADVVEKSDLCFVWLWERRSGTDKGLGAKCLELALQDIRRRFKKVRTVLLDVRPSQFVIGRGDVEPPMVAIERQTAIENLVTYIQRIGLDFDARPVFTRLNNPQRDSLLALGESMGMGMGDPYADAGAGANDTTIDLDTWEEAITDLLRMAGLDELAGRLEDGEEVYLDVETALKELVFGPHVQYLRVSSTSGFYPTQVGIDPIPHEVAHEQIEGFDDFCSHLPVHMWVASVDDVEDSIVCTVRARTPFGELTEYFALIPKPRPINIESFFRNLM